MSPNKYDSGHRARDQRPATTVFLRTRHLDSCIEICCVSRLSLVKVRLSSIFAVGTLAHRFATLSTRRICFSGLRDHAFVLKRRRGRVWHLQ